MIYLLAYIYWFIIVSWKILPAHGVCTQCQFCTGHSVVQTVFTERLSFTPGSAFQDGSDANSVLFSALQDNKAGFLSVAGPATIQSPLSTTQTISKHHNSSLDKHRDPEKLSLKSGVLKKNSALEIFIVGCRNRTWGLAILE